MANRERHQNQQGNNSEAGSQSPKKPPSSGHFNFTSVVSTVLVTLLVIGYLFQDSPFARKILSHFKSPPPIGYSTELFDSSGQKVTLENFRGRWLIVLFGFVSCPDICPTHLAYLAKELKELNKKSAFPSPQTFLSNGGGNPQNVTGIFVSVDPHRDTLNQLEAYRQHFDKGFGQLVAVTGNEENLRILAKSYGAFFEYRKGDKKAEPNGDYDVAHSTGFFIISPTGHLVNTLTPPLLSGQLATRVTEATRKF